MLLWKLIMDRWHLTHEDISICRLVLQVAEQTSAKVCPACLDAIADERLQWQSLNLELMMRLDSQSSPEPSTSAKDADETS
jgi:hypothetical protein